MTPKIVPLCPDCMKAMQNGFSVTYRPETSHRKRKCALCGKESYWAAYELGRKGAEPHA